MTWKSARERRCYSEPDPRLADSMRHMGRRSVEVWAARLIERELKRPVLVHDDGTQPGLYDLRIGPSDAPEAAIECVGAVDRIRTEAWNIGPAKGPISLNVDGDWHVVLKPTARITRVRPLLEGLLQAMEDVGFDGFIPVDWHLRRKDSHQYDTLKSLGITSLHRIRIDGGGKVHLGMTGIGGWVDSTGQAVPSWVREFLLDPEREDVIAKLDRSGASECHVFIPVSFAGVPWDVESYLGSAIESLPPKPPDLPTPVSRVWIVYGQTGLRWDGSEWLLFNAA